MNTPNVFSVQNDDLARLDPKQAVELVRDLLWAEARPSLSIWVRQ